MLSEALVIFACVNSTGCSPTSSLYYNTHPELKEFVDKTQIKVVEFVGPMTIQTLGPVLYMAAGGTGTVRLDKYFSLQLKSNKAGILFGKDF